MRRQFNHPRCSILVVTGNAQLPASDLISETFVEAVIARKDFRGLSLPIDSMSLTTGDDSYSSLLSDKRTRKPADQFQRCRRRRLFVIRIDEP